MIPEWTVMADAMPQLRSALAGLETDLAYQVLARWPRREDTDTLITITEIVNQQSTRYPVVDQLSYQVDIWAAERDTVRALAPLVNAALCGIGLRREYASPEEPWQDGSRYFRRTFRFGRNIDKRIMRFVD